MKLKKQKRHRRSVKFYTTCFGFREPFNILCDGTFIHNLVVNKIKSAGDALSDILHASTRLFTTKCVIAELKSLGDTYSESLQAAHHLITTRCDHEKRKSAVACIEEVIGEHNHEHFFLATQDTSLREKFRKIAGVPVIFGLRNSLFLEQPSEFQRQYVKSAEEERLHVTEWEYKMLQKRKENESSTQIETDSPEAHEGSADDIVMPKAVAETKARRRTLGVIDKAQFKRKKAKGPNPLSCKKKQNLGDKSRAPTQGSKDGENVNGKRKRKRKRSRKGTNHAEADA
ncbi:rRNA-processing protein UTP23 homolog [Telopea speciosissima]|uniref:rRNA-processing protein UTP23 homolog n=1 Tax=Telopea speciosissima TaxID=54955 RepID=UPI001CC55D8D|nr:rRNA-processing protein UTP23 homolog [Telopea speciosissima]XP_043704540.1 rRNA-processing protein UTP23 homolog [Telopea speciosissima]XP_043704541.1 rRNA-processing protein UTP23 homolog [Telopea speciosissima]